MPHASTPDETARAAATRAAPGATPPIRRLGEGDLDAALALSTAAGWNQTRDDWALFLAHGTAWGIDDGGTLAASAAVLPHGAAIAWVSMILTLPDRRGRGYGTALLAHALAALRASGHRAVLDSVPAGTPVYAALGFRPVWTLRRWRIGTGGEAGAEVRPLRAEDWPALLALDRAAHGADREPLLRAIAARLPGAAFVAMRGGSLTGYALARDGRLGPQVGPVVAAEDGIAQALVAAALAALPQGASAVIDCPDHRSGIVAWLEARGGAPLRTFTRMGIGDAPLPGDPALLAAPAGPEFG